MTGRVASHAAPQKTTADRPTGTLAGVSSWTIKGVPMARQSFEVAHITFSVCDKDRTFSLIAHDAAKPLPRPLFTGLLDADMPDQLRALADHLDGLQ